MGDFFIYSFFDEKHSYKPVVPSHSPPLNPVGPPLFYRLLWDMFLERHVEEFSYKNTINILGVPTSVPSTGKKTINHFCFISSFFRLFRVLSGFILHVPTSRYWLSHFLD